MRDWEVPFTPVVVAVFLLGVIGGMWSPFPVAVSAALGLLGGWLIESWRQSHNRTVRLRRAASKAEMTW